MTEEDIAAARSMTLPELKRRWRDLVSEATPLVGAAPRDAAARNALSDIGRRMEKLLALSCLWNLDDVSQTQGPRGGAPGSSAAA